jgi:hypothetical protein
LRRVVACITSIATNAKTVEDLMASLLGEMIIFTRNKYLHPEKFKEALMKLYNH